MKATNEWQAAWQPTIDQIGTDFDTPGRDTPTIEREGIRRYIEALEFDCPLHYSTEAARSAGFPDIVLPSTALPSFSLPHAWLPGETLFPCADRHAVPPGSVTQGYLAGTEPPTSHFVATNYEADYLGCAVVGDRLHRRGARLIACVPKATRLGIGAFLTWETEILNQHDEILAIQRITFYRYNPRSS